MNLKEAFRFQNKLAALMDEAQGILSLEQNITKVQNTYLRKKVMVEAEDETTIDIPPTEYGEQITEVAVLLMYLLEQREQLSGAICRAKAGLDLSAGLDGEVGLNAKRQEVAAVFRRMAGLRASETLIPNGGTGYRFNNEGNQVAYRCDVRRVTTINFDRNQIRDFGARLSKQADQVSAALDAALVNTEVDYVPPFDVNDTFAEVFEVFTKEKVTS